MSPWRVASGPERSEIVTATKSQSVAVGDGKCLLCGGPVVVKATGKGHLVYTCPTPADGGCGCQVFARYAKSDALLAKLVTKWRKPEYRDRWKGQIESEPEAAPPATAPEPETTPPPEPVEPGETDEQRTLRELGG